MATPTTSTPAPFHTYLATPTMDYLKSGAIQLLNWAIAPAGAGNPKDYEILLKIYKGEAPSGRTAIKNDFEQLTPSSSEKIFYYVRKIAKSTSSDPDWGEHNAFKDIPRLKKAIKHFAAHKFDSLDKVHKKAVADKVYKVALRSHGAAWARQHAKDWGMRHAKDSSTILLQALGDAPVIANPEKGQKHKSSLYNLHRKELSHGQIGYINGMGVSKEKAKKDAIKLSDTLGKKYNFHCVHAASNGAQDYYEAVLNYGGVVTPPVQLLHECWDKFFAKAKGDKRAKFLQICSSKGAIHVKVALKTYNEKLRKQIHVLAIAPADLIEKGLCGRVRHLVNESDSVPFISPSASRLYKQDPDIIMVASEPKSNPHDLHGKGYRKDAALVVKSFINKQREVRRSGSSTENPD